MISFSPGPNPIPVRLVAALESHLSSCPPVILPGSSVATESEQANNRPSLGAELPCTEAPAPQKGGHLARSALRATSHYVVAGQPGPRAGCQESLPPAELL